MTYHSQIPYLLPYDHLLSRYPNTSTNPNDHLISRDPKNSINPDDHSQIPYLLSRDPNTSTNPNDHLISRDPKNSTNPDDLNPTLTDVPISVISGDVLPQPGTWKRIQNSSRSLASPQGIKLQTKRSSSTLSDPIELPCKHRLVSQKDNGNTKLLAKAG